MCLLQADGEIRRSSACNEVAIGIMSARQLDDAGGCAGTLQAPRKLVSGALTGLVFILVKDDVDRARGAITELLELTRRQMCADGAGGIAKAGLPKHGQVEQTFDQDHGGEVADRLPGKQAAFGTR